MTQRDLLTCFHEPFGDAFYFGPEKISQAWRRWPADKIEKSGRAHYTYDFVLGMIQDAIEVKMLPLLRSPRAHDEIQYIRIPRSVSS